MPRETLQGTLDLLILKTLAPGSEHGYGITCYILNASQNQLRVEEGSLYPALRRMEADGLFKAEWRASENNRRVTTTSPEQARSILPKRWSAGAGTPRPFP